MNQNLFYRSIELQARTTGDRNISLSFSSEEPVERWFGSEILLHGQNNVDLARLQAVGSLIYGHDPGRIENVLGKIARAWIENRRGHAEVVMDTDPVGQAALVKIQSGSLRGVSFGYMITQAQRLEEGETWQDPDSGQSFDGPAMVATRWTPYEITLTPIPADATVGIGREVTRSLEGIRIIKSSSRERKEIKMDVDTIANTIVTRITEAEKIRRDLIGYGRIIGAKAEAYVSEAIKEGKSITEIQGRLLDLAGVTPDAAAVIAPRGAIRSFRQITDDQFFAGLSNPSAMRIDGGPLHSGAVKPRQDQGSRVTFRQIDDDVFFAGLSNPAEYGG